MGARARHLILAVGIAACCHSPEPEPGPYSVAPRIVIPLGDDTVRPSIVRSVPDGMECRIEGERGQRVLICEESPLVEEGYTQ